LWLVKGYTQNSNGDFILLEETNSEGSDNNNNSTEGVSEKGSVTQNTILDFQFYAANNGSPSALIHALYTLPCKLSFFLFFFHFNSQHFFGVPLYEFKLQRRFKEDRAVEVRLIQNGLCCVIDLIIVTMPIKLSMERVQ